MRRRSENRTARVMESIRVMVTNRSVIAGDRLPSIRSFAAQMGVSPSTVVEAYERLAAEGLIRARAGSGFYVSGPAAPFIVTDTGPDLDRAIDPVWVSRQSLDAYPGIPKPGCGWLPANGCRAMQFAGRYATSPKRKVPCSPIMASRAGRYRCGACLPANFLQRVSPPPPSKSLGAFRGRFNHRACEYKEAFGNFHTG